MPSPFLKRVHRDDLRDETVEPERIRAHQRGEDQGRQDVRNKQVGNGSVGHYTV